MDDIGGLFQSEAEVLLSTLLPYARSAHVLFGDIDLAMVEMIRIGTHGHIEGFLEKAVDAACGAKRKRN
jgi:hypothetical protein